MWQTGILVPQAGLEPVAPVVEAWSLNHWTTREVPPVDVLIAVLDRFRARDTWLSYARILDPQKSTDNVHCFKLLIWG